MRVRIITATVAMLWALVACTSSSPPSSARAPSTFDSGAAATTTTTTATSTTASPVTTTTTTLHLANTVAAAPPDADQIAAEVARTHEAENRDESFDAEPPITVSDGEQGYLTAVAAHRNPSADGHGWLLFFWHDQTFLGWDTNFESWNVGVRAATDAIEATYANHAAADAACCPTLPDVTITYRWHDRHFTQDRPLPPGAVVQIQVTTAAD